MAEKENVPSICLDFYVGEYAFWDRRYRGGMYVQIVNKFVTDHEDHQAGIPHKYQVQDVQSKSIHNGIAGIELLKVEEYVEEEPSDQDFEPTPQRLPTPPPETSKPRLFKKKTPKEKEVLLGSRTSDNTNQQTKWASKALRYL